MKHGSKLAKHANPPNHPVPLQVNRIQRFNLFRVFGYLGIAVVFGGLTLWNHFMPMWTPLALPGGTRVHALQLAQCGVILLLAILWVVATNREFKLWTDMLKKPTEKKQAYAAIIALSFGLGVSLAFSFDIVWLSLTFTIYLLVNYWSQWLTNDYFARALQETRASTDDSTRSAVLDVMEQYWLQRPQLARITTMMFFSSIAFSVAFTGNFDKAPRGQWLQSAANLLLILNIVIGESIIAWWRRQRNKGIREQHSVKNKEEHDPFDGSETVDVPVFDTFKTAAYWGIFAVAGIAVGVTLEDFKRMWALPATNSELPLYLARIVLFFLIFALIFRWVIATQNEMNMWKRRLTNPPIEKENVYAAIFGLAIVLGLALAFVYSILFISILMTVTLLVNYWTQWITNDYFKHALERTVQTATDAVQRSSLEAMRHYWLVRPQLARITTLMFFSSLSLAFALAGKVHSEQRRAAWEITAYFILIASILIGEIVISYWRIRRDKDMAQARYIKGAKK